MNQEKRKNVFQKHLYEVNGKQLLIFYKNIISIETTSIIHKKTVKCFM